MRLPEKVQKKHFTREEQIFLSGHFEGVIPDAADDIFYKLRHQRNQSVPTLSISLNSSKSSTISTDQDCLFEKIPEMDVSTLEGFRWMEDDDELDLSLDDYHAHIIPTTDSFPKSASRRPSFRRKLSLTNLPFGSARSITKCAPPKPVEPPPTLPMLTHQISSHRTPGKSSRTRASLERSVDSSTKHYQDPEARLKLRVYLASPQKFDEALEFGFPSLEDREMLPSRRPSLPKHHTDSILRTFLNEDNISFFGSQDGHDTETSIAEVNSPKRPSTTFFHSSDQVSILNPTSTDSHPSLEHCASRTSEPYAYVLAGSREMTLRMTLTRQDLRAHENHLDAATDDPLALEHLPPLHEAGDIWDRHSKEGMVKKIWHRVSRKSSAA